MTYFEFLIAALIGLQLKAEIQDELGGWDRIALSTARVFAVLVFVYPLVILRASTQRIVKKKKKVEAIEIDVKHIDKKKTVSARVRELVPVDESIEKMPSHQLQVHTLEYEDSP